MYNKYLTVVSFFFFSFLFLSASVIPFIDYETEVFEGDTYLVVHGTPVSSSGVSSYGYKIGYRLHRHYINSITGEHEVNTSYLTYSHAGVHISRFAWNSIKYAVYVSVTYNAALPPYSIPSDVFLSMIDTDNPDSYPEDYELISENFWLTNPFDQSLWMRVYFNDQQIDQKQLYPGDRENFDFQAFAGPDDDREFKYQISDNGITYEPGLPVNKTNLMQMLADLFRNIVGWGTDDSNPDIIDPIIPDEVTEVTTSAKYDLQWALQNQQLSGGQIQQAFEQGLINNSVTANGIKMAFVNGVLLSGMPDELRSLNSAATTLNNSINNISLDNSDVVSAIHNINVSSDNADVVSAINDIVYPFVDYSSYHADLQQSVDTILHDNSLRTVKVSSISEALDVLNEDSAVVAIIDAIENKDSIITNNISLNNDNSDIVDSISDLQIDMNSSNEEILDALNDLNSNSLSQITFADYETPTVVYEDEPENVFEDTVQASYDTLTTTKSTLYDSLIGIFDMSFPAIATVGKKSFLHLDLVWNGMGDFSQDIDFSIYSVELDWFRRLMLLCLYISAFITSIKMIGWAFSK